MKHSTRTANLWAPLAGLVLAGFAAGAAAAEADDFACRASAVRIDLLDLEPFVANDAGTPCADDGVALLGATTLGDVSASVLSADTTFNDPGTADGTVAQGFAATALADVAGIVSAEVLVAEARVDQVGGVCQLSGSSFVGSAIVAGTPVEVGGEHLEIEIPFVGTVHFNETIEEANAITQRAVWFEPTLDPLGGVVISEARAGFDNAAACDGGGGPGDEHGWITGGGSVFGDAGRVTHGFRLECDAADGPNRLQVNWGKGNRFHLESVAEAACSDDAALDPGKPGAGFDTHTGSGQGRLNGVSGATASWVITDAGEPGTADVLTLSITDADNNEVLSVSGPLDRGNHQAHGQ